MNFPLLVKMVFLSLVLILPVAASDVAGPSRRSSSTKPYAGSVVKVSRSADKFVVRSRDSGKTKSFSIMQYEAFNTRGKQLSSKAYRQHLRVGTPVLISQDGRPVSRKYLTRIDPNTLVLVEVQVEDSAPEDEDDEMTTPRKRTPKSKAAKAVKQPRKRPDLKTVPKN